jgi:catechol 2,3-dioxygenase-like lactoylglutathione lyase family enzyme
MAVELDHVGLGVADIQRSLDWYEENLDAVRMRDVPEATTAGVPIAFVSLGNHELEFVESRPRDRRTPTRGSDVGAAHIAIHVPDIGPIYERIARNGGKPSTEPSELLPGVLSFYCQDPDGFRVQLIQLPASNGEAHGLRYANGFHHVAFTVSDLERVLGWYSRLLGLQVGTRTTGGGDLVSRMFEVSEGAYDVALIPIGDTFLEIMEWATSPAAEAPAGPGTVAWHLGIRVDDLATTHEQALAAGIEVAGPPSWFNEGPGSTWGAFIVHDPDGLHVQLKQDLSDQEG